MSEELEIKESATEKLQKLLKAGGRTLNHYPLLLESALIVKEAAAVANGEIGALETQKARAIESACKALRSNLKKLNCPINIVRSLGAPLNFAVSDLICQEAAKAGIAVTFEDVMKNQAEADVTATVKMLTVSRAIDPLLMEGTWFVGVLREKAREFKTIVKTSRANLRDGLPVSLGDEFEAYAVAMEDSLKRLAEEKRRWRVSALGLGEAGTGLGSSRAFQKKANEALKAISGLVIEEPVNAIAALGGAHNLVLAHAYVEAVALVLWRTAHDLGLMCSGPRGGIREIAFPAVAPGSSIMPGKVNPTVAELAMLVADNVLSNRWASTMGTHSGWLGAAPASSVPLKAFMDSTDLLARTLRIFGTKVVQGITAFPDRCLAQAQSSLALVHALDYFVDALTRSRVVEIAQDKKESILEAAKALKVLPDEVLEDILDPKHLMDRKAVEEMLKRHADILS